MEQGKNHWPETAIATGTRLVDPCQVAPAAPRDPTLFNQAIDSKLRACDLVTLRVSDVAPNGYTLDRASVRQKKTGRPVRFQLTKQTRRLMDAYFRSSRREPAQFLFPVRGGPDRRLTTRQYARLVGSWVGSIGLDNLCRRAHKRCSAWFPRTICALQVLLKLSRSASSPVSLELLSTIRSHRSAIKRQKSVAKWIAGYLHQAPKGLTQLQN